MSEVMSDAELVELDSHTKWMTGGGAFVVDADAFRALRARLSAVEAERDAAVAKLVEAGKEVVRLTAIYYSPSGDNHHNALKCPHCRPGYEAERAADMEEGAWRERVATLAFLRGGYGTLQMMVSGSEARDLADAIERADHITATASPAAGGSE